MDVFPLRLIDRPSAAELKQAVQRAQGQGYEAKEAARVEADGEIDIFLLKINRSVAGEGDGSGSALEIAGAEDALLNIESAERSLRALNAGELVIQHFGNNT